MLRRIIASFIIVAVGVIVAVIVVPPLLLRDAPAPASLAPFVESARGSVRSQSIEGPLSWWPVHFQFIEARCSSEHTGRVALIFEAWWPPYLWKSYAVAMRGSFPTSPDSSWSGGVGIGSVFDEDEFVYLMGANTIPCQ